MNTIHALPLLYCLYSEKIISNLVQSVSDIYQMYPTPLDAKEPFKNYLWEMAECCGLKWFVAGTEESNTPLILSNYPENYGLELWRDSELFANTKSLLKLVTITLKMNDSAREVFFKRTSLW